MVEVLNATCRNCAQSGLLRPTGAGPTDWVKIDYDSAVQTETLDGC